ncbi:16S rRNA (uracil(1498)-N(3))-methyltransferase [Magnetovibrio sp.]|uniref:16S rRNA (uracil(1498)-N(3))-methyltransferase n=1 Tax=Magnetovibrio sp. TaxID=2024836 RepID=UPI002F935062
MSESKSITRIYCETDLGAGLSVPLGPGPAHKLRAVLRAKSGDEVQLFNDRDGEWRARLVDLGKTQASSECLTQLRAAKAEPGPWLAFAPLKKDRLDMVVEKAVELGVERLIPVITARTENRRLKMERLIQQTIDAAEQCERLSVPEILEPVAIEKLAAMWPEDRTLLVAAERQNVPSLAQKLETVTGSLGILIGPEGGFETRELDGLLKLPISIAIRLGPRILRAETAAIAALAVMQAQCGDWRDR